MQRGFLCSVADGVLSQESEPPLRSGRRRYQDGLTLKRIAQPTRSQVISRYSAKCQIECGSMRSATCHLNCIATGLVPPAVSSVGHSAESRVGPWWLAPTGARGTLVHTSHLVDRQVVPNKRVVMASGVIDARCPCLFGGEQYLRQSAAKCTPLGISVCVLRTYCCGSFLAFHEFSFYW